MIFKIGDAINDIQTYDAYSFNTIFADPPYQLGSEWIINKAGEPHLKVRQDFMQKWDAIDGNEWDKFFENAFRILKYGGYCVLFCIERQSWVLCYYATKHGFQVCQSLFWHFLEGFPKGVDVSGLIDKRAGKKGDVISFGNGVKCNSNSEIYNFNNEKYTIKSIYEIRQPVTEKAIQYHGYKYGIAPFKPTVETILVFRKPPLKSIIDDIETENSKVSPSVINIKDTRVPLLFGEDLSVERNGTEKIDTSNMGWGFKKMPRDNSGRYIGQLFLTFETAEIIDKQTGKSDEKRGSKVSHICDYENEELEPVIYCAKVHNPERNAGLYNNEKNKHPTLKPIKLTTKIASLFKLPDDIEQKWYVPFAGTLSEVIGIIKAGGKENHITICEAKEDYIKIGLKRLYKLTGIKINYNIEKK